MSQKATHVTFHTRRSVMKFVGIFKQRETSEGVAKSPGLNDFLHRLEYQTKIILFGLKVETVAKCCFRSGSVPQFNQAAYIEATITNFVKLKSYREVRTFALNIAFTRTYLGHRPKKIPSKSLSRN